MPNTDKLQMTGRRRMFACTLKKPPIMRGWNNLCLKDSSPLFLYSCGYFFVHSILQVFPAAPPLSTLLFQLEVEMWKRRIMCHLQTSGLRFRQHIGCVNDAFSTHMLTGTRLSAAVEAPLSLIVALDLSLKYMKWTGGQFELGKAIWTLISQSDSTFKHISGCRTADISLLSK